MPTESRERIQCVTPRFRVSYANVMSPRKARPGQPAPSTEQYDCLCIFDPVSEMTQEDKDRWNFMLQAAQKVKEAFFTTGIPDNYRSPLKDGTAYNAQHGSKNPEFIGKVLMNIKSHGIKPGLVDANMQRIIDPAKFYSGCFAIADGSWYAYNKMGNAGITFGVNNIMKVADGEPLGNTNNPESAFSAIDTSAYRTATAGAGLMSGGAVEDLI